MQLWVVVILSGDFEIWAQNHTFELRDKSHLLADLYGLSAASRAEFVEEPARVGFDSVFADEEFVGDFAITQPLCDQLEDFELPSRDAEIFESLFVEGERLGCGHSDFPNDHDFFLSGQLQPEPDTETGEKHRHEPPVNLDRMLDDEEAKLDQLEQDDQNPTGHTINDYLFSHANRILQLFA